MTKIKLGLVAAGALCASTMVAGTASAMPVGGLAAASEVSDGITQARWVCGPFRCWWRPGPRYYGWGGPRYHGYRAYGFYGRPYGGYYGRSWWGGGY
jgi:hypothetical protein